MFMIVYSQNVMKWLLKTKCTLIVEIFIYIQHILILINMLDYHKIARVLLLK